MKELNVSFSGLDVDYHMAARLAATIARELNSGEPIMVAWHDKRRSRMSPVIEGGDINTRWRDYGESHGGKLEVDINGEYDFIFADSAAFETHQPSPFMNVRDAQGHEYLCQINALRDPKNPTEEACVPLTEDDTVSHAG
jgi:hypothetical protein